MTTKLSIEFGALSPPLHTQLDGFDVPAKQIRRWQRVADAITMLAINGFIPQAQRDSARKKLFKEIAATVKKGVK